MTKMVASFSVRAPPVLQWQWPQYAAPGSTAQLFGTGFTGATSVVLAGAAPGSVFQNGSQPPPDVAAAFTVVNDGHIDVIVPSGVTYGWWKITTPSGSDTGLAQFIVSSAPRPSIVSQWPQRGAVASIVHLVGSNFATTVRVRLFPSCCINAADTTWTVVDDSHLDVVVPDGVPVGRFRVDTANGEGDTANAPFTVTATPPLSIASQSPQSGHIGDAVILEGAGFTGATSVDLGGTPAAFTIVSGSRIAATVPVGATTGSWRIGTPTDADTGFREFTVLP